MGILGNLFRKKTETEENRVGGIEDIMTLIRVYYQAVMAGNLGISNINMLPDLAMFKRSLKVATQNNKLGVAERSRCKKMLMQIYGLNEAFFKEIDARLVQKYPSEKCKSCYKNKVFRQTLLQKSIFCSIIWHLNRSSV